EMSRCRSRVDDDRSAVGQLVERHLRDPLLLLRKQVLAVSHSELDAETLHGNRPAVNSPHHAKAFKRCQVSPDGLRGDVEIVGKLPDFHATLATGPTQDLLVTF